MIQNQHLLCLDQCHITPKLITNKELQELHKNHEYQTIENIRNRINQQDNLRVIDQFLTQCSLNSLLAENENRKQSILKDFEVNLTRFFEEITRNLTQQWKENKRLTKILLAISPEYKPESLSKIQGDFSFLKDEKFKELQKQSMMQIQRSLKAKSDIEEFVQQTKELFKQKVVPEIQSIDNVINQSISPVKKDDQFKKKHTRTFFQHQIMQVMQQNKLSSLQKINFKKDEIKQSERVVQVRDSLQQFEFEFDKEDRNLIIRRSGTSTTNRSDMVKMVNLCLECQPNSLSINLQDNGVTDISPLIELKALINLNSLIIDLKNNGVTDIYPLSKLKALINLTSVYINLECNRGIVIQPLSELKGLLNLRSLTLKLGMSRIQSINPLAELKSLVNLTSLIIELGNNGVEDISPLSELKALVKLTTLTLNLQDNRVIDIQPLSNLKDLVNLTSLTIELWQNGVINIYPLIEFKALINLTSLTIYLEDNRIEDISPLSKFKALVNLISLEIYFGRNNLPKGSLQHIMSYHQLKKFFT